MNWNAVFLGATCQHGQSLVGAPLQVRWCQLGLNALLAMVLGPQMLEERNGLGGRHSKAGKVLGKQGTDILGYASQELLVVLIHEMVLLAQCVAVGNAHADILIGTDDRLRLLLGLARIAGKPAMKMLDRGRAGGKHFESPI